MNEEPTGGFRSLKEGGRARYSLAARSYSTEVHRGVLGHVAVAAVDLQALVEDPTELLQGRLSGTVTAESV
ncbi:hypothetical protein [Rhodococcus erythropolis]|uniref:hypothetical protein n=1 Tax=Rhodococcus erythropolis TaxID=1833 RepID=UPI0024B67C2B|nr:hypothetical protein [Rhodococcus erythropolis]MDJ0015494.1 hypothetical protein [Rhodococcus erythropolis]